MLIFVSCLCAYCSLPNSFMQLVSLLSEVVLVNYQEHECCHEHSSKSPFYPLTYLWPRAFRWHSVKESVCNVGDIGESGSIPGLGRSPGGGNGNPLQYPCLKNPLDRGACWATLCGVAQSWTWLNSDISEFNIDTNVFHLFVKIATVVRMPEERFMEGSGIFGCMEETDLMAGSNGASQSWEEKLWEDGNK